MCIGGLHGVESRGWRQWCQAQPCCHNNPLLRCTAHVLLYCRYLLRELVVSYLTRQFPKWTAIDKALETEGWKLVTLLRLSPIVSALGTVLVG